MFLGLATVLQSMWNSKNERMFEKALMKNYTTFQHVENNMKSSQVFLHFKV